MVSTIPKSSLQKIILQHALRIPDHENLSLFCLSHTADIVVTVGSTNFGLLPIFISLNTFGERTLPLPSAPFPSLIFHVALLLPVLRNGPSDISFLLLVFER